MKTSEFWRLYTEAGKNYDEKNYDAALDKINTLLNINKNCYVCRDLKAAILIESWDGSESTQGLIKEAMSHLDLAIKEDPDNKAVYLGNKGNALVALAEMQLKKTGNDFKLNSDIINTLMNAKDCYQGSLDIDENQPNLWINKGNVLDYLGRHLEAIECYDMAILKDSEYYNAWGNRGLTCWKLSGFLTEENDKQSLFYHSMLYLGIELVLYPDFEIDESIKTQIKEFIKINKVDVNTNNVLKNMLPKKILLLEEGFNFFEHYDIPFEQFYNDFCEREGFFLNTHFDCSNCGCSRLDLLKFSILSKSGDYKTPYNFMIRLHNILDEYNTARFLLALAQYRCKDFTFLDKPRCDPEFSLNYLYNVELLKEAFIKIMTICDKIAFFLVDYEKLSRKDGKILNESDVYFWGGKNIFSQTNILENNHYQKDLVAINTIRIDLEKGEFKNLRNIRNMLIHRYFVLHYLVDPKQLTYPYDSNRELLEDREYHEDVNRFFMITKKSLRLIRNMLFSLSFFVDYKEKQKTADVKGPIPHFSWGHFPGVDLDEL